MRRVLLAVLGLSAIAGATKAALISPASPVVGISQAALADQWWQFVLPIPTPINPVTDPTGAYAGVNNNGPVFFLAGSSSGDFAHRSLTVPAGKPLFFPLINVADTEVPVNIDPNTCLAAADSYSCAAANIAPFSKVSGLVATLDGTALDPNLATDFASYHQMSSALLPTCLPADNIAGTPLLSTVCGAEFVQSGYYMALDSLTPGTYTLVFGGAFPDFGFFAGAVDTITVVPEPASRLLLGTGLVALVLVRRSRAIASGTRRPAHHPACG